MAHPSTFALSSGQPVASEMSHGFKSSPLSYLSASDSLQTLVANPFNDAVLIVSTAQKPRGTEWRAGTLGQNQSPCIIHTVAATIQQICDW
jgi:hypothetical protein